MTKIIQPDWVKAKPRAVPRNGAVHGVARTVAKTPWKNEPASPSRALQPSKLRLALCGNDISKTPNRFRAKINTTALMKRTKYGLVNWNAQVISRPNDFRTMRRIAKP